MGVSPIKGNNAMSYENSQRAEHLSDAKLKIPSVPMPSVIGLEGKSAGRFFARVRHLDGPELQTGAPGICKEAELKPRHYEEVYELAPFGYQVLDSRGVIRNINTTAAMLFGAEKDFLLGKPFLLWVAEESKELYKQHFRRLSDTGERMHCKLKLLGSDGTPFPVALECRRLAGVDGSSAEYLVAFHDISEQVEIETKFRDMNTAFKVLLKQHEEDKDELERSIRAGIRKLVIPYVERLKQARLGEEQAQCLQSILANIESHVASSRKNLNLHYDYLTPREIAIVNLVRDGHGTKEIASLLSVSAKSVEFHKYNIRRKMGLTKKKLNLRTHLASLDAY